MGQLKYLVLWACLPMTEKALSLILKLQIHFSKEGEFVHTESVNNEDQLYICLP